MISETTIHVLFFTWFYVSFLAAILWKYEIDFEGARGFKDLTKKGQVLVFLLLLPIALPFAIVFLVSGIVFNLHELFVDSSWMWKEPTEGDC